MKLSLIALACLSTPLFGQNIRESVQLGPGTSPDVIASSEEHSVALWVDGVSEDKLWASTSDGRGLEWSQPFALSEDYGWADNVRVEMVEGRTYAAWSKGESSPNDGILLAARSMDGGLTWSAPIQLPGAVAWDSWENRVLGMAVVPEPAGDRVHLLLQTAESELSLVSSYDAGASYGAPVTVTTEYQAGGELAVTGSNLHVVWIEQNEFDFVQRYRRSADAGISVEPPIQILALPNDSWNFLHVAADGELVVVGSWGKPTTVRAHVSFDGGATFQTPVDLPHGLPHPDGWLYNTQSSLHVRGSEVWMSWSRGYWDGPFSEGAIEVAHSSNGGLTWSAPQTVLANDSTWVNLSYLWVNGRLILLLGFDGHSAMLWDPVTASFGPAFDVTTTATSSELMVTVNELYSNVIVHFEGPGNQMYTGGFRPQTLTANGFVAGSSLVNFDLERLSPSGSVGWVLMALSTNSLSLPDGRQLGLALDPLLVTSLDLVGLGLLSAVLDSTGAGSTPLIPAGLPPGLTLQAVALDLDLGTGAIGAITDVVEIGL